MQSPSIGRIVQYRFRDSEHVSGERPAIIVRVWSTVDPAPANASVQLQVFTDQGNDGLDGVVWRTSVARGFDEGQYHFHDDKPEDFN